MKQKLMKSVLGLLAFTFVLTGCSSNEVSLETDATNKLNSQLEDQIVLLSDILLKASNSSQVVAEVHRAIEKSLVYGLDETMYIDDVMNTNKCNVKSNSNSSGASYSHLRSILKAKKGNGTSEKLSINGLEIYWPYSEDWDGNSIPVIAHFPSNEEYIDGDKLMAYRYTKLTNGHCVIDSFLVDEAYSMKNPVWVIKKSSFSSNDLVHIFNGESTASGLKYCPRDKRFLTKSTAQLASASNKIAETMIDSIQSTVQHDTWVSGGSEYILYWFFPTANFGLAEHHTEQIIFSRKEIGKKTTRAINFAANYDWFVGQSHNRLKVIEFDPGKDMSFEVKMSGTYKPKDSEFSISGDFKTTININNVDESIMEHTIPRTAMLTAETKVSDVLFRKSFTGNGVKVVVSIRGIEGLEL